MSPDWRIREQAIKDTIEAALRTNTAEAGMEKSQLRDLRATKTWWSSAQGVPKALQAAGAWGSIGAPMLMSYPADMIVCQRSWPRDFDTTARCWRIGDTRMPVELTSGSWSLMKTDGL